MNVDGRELPVLMSATRWSYNGRSTESHSVFFLTEGTHSATPRYSSDAIISETLSDTTGSGRSDVAGAGVPPLRCADQEDSPEVIELANRGLAAARAGHADELAALVTRACP